MLHIVKTFKGWWRKLETIFEPLPLEEAIADELEDAIKEKMQAEAVIKSHEFIKHMARAKIEALNEWMIHHS